MLTFAMKSTRFKTPESNLFMSTRMKYSLMLAGFMILANIISLHTFSQEDYIREWDRAIALEKDGLPRSAMKMADSIYHMALSDGDAPQMIKALEYSIRMSSRFEEDHFRKSIDRITAELPHFVSPAKQVMYALQAELYLGYYAANRYLILDRTMVGDQELKDMATWDQLRFAEVIFNTFKASLADPEMLKKTPAANYADILRNFESPDIFRPTLYDILAHNALDFYANDEFSASRPAEQFQIDDPGMIDIAEEFVKLNFKKKENFSMKYHALTLFRDLIAFHLNDEDPSALVDVDLQRLDFVLANAVFDDTEMALRHTLEQMESLYIGTAPVAEIYFRLATSYRQTSDLYRPLESNDHKKDLIIAEQYCENAMAEFPGSYGAKLCENLLIVIKEKNLGTELEYANLPGKYILASLSFKNVKTVFVRVVRVKPEDDREWKRNRDNNFVISQFNMLRPEKNWSIELPVELDHNNHLTEFAIPPLTEGFYGLMVSDNAAFDNVKGIVYLNRFWVSNISYISNKEKNGDYLFYVLGREKGNPLTDVKVRVFAEVYDPNLRDQRLEERYELLTDAAGAFKVPAAEGENARLVIDLQKGPDRYISPRYFYSARSWEQVYRKNNITYFFTDRSIYRPGQTIYFKGILLEQEGKNYTLRENTETKIQFYDANNQLVSSLDLTSNEFGSVQGSFIAPVGVLNGTMHIRNESGIAGISVEEYKRPRFEVTFDPIKGSYKLGEKVLVKGKAAAYSGQAIDHARVKYRIVRSDFSPYPYYRGGSPWYSQPTEIRSGETETREDGSFSITFTAIPDRGPNKMFSFMVYADVSDPTGETHSGQKDVLVGENALLIKLDMPELLNSNNINAFPISTTNLNGAACSTQLDVTVSRLKTPGIVYQNYDWRKEPDIYVMDKEKFREHFPDYAYKNENDRATWGSEEIVFKSIVNTGETGELTLNDLRRWKPGEYLVELKAVDEFGKIVNVKQYFTLFNPSSDEMPLITANWFVPLNVTGEPGEKAEVLIGTSYDNARVLIEVQAREGNRRHEWITLSREQRKIEIPILETDRGGLALNMVFIRQNKSYNNIAKIDVPYTNKRLDITFETFRDKLLPGQEEHWNIKIRGNKGEKVAAEMLAGMYDASLDFFRPHRWFFDIHNYRFTNNYWETYDTFHGGYGQIFKKYAPYKAPPVKTYPKLSWEGIYYQGMISPYYYKDRPMDALMMVADVGRAAGEKGIAEEETDDRSGQKQAATDVDEIQIVKHAAVKEPFMPRRNLQETAFFFPQLRTNAEGDVILSFTMPESLTRWRLMALAHTQDLSTGYIEKELVTQKDLMIVPNLPRFLRVGDEIIFSAGVVNLTDKELRGTASLQFFDAITMAPVDAQFDLDSPKVSFSSKKGESARVSWTLKVADITGPVVYRVMANTGKMADGEEGILPVLQNRMLVTESLPLPVKGNEHREFVFESFKNISDSSITLRNFSYTLEFTPNPAWYAVQALPYMMEGQQECSEKIYSQVYANSIAAHIVQQQPGIKRIFESWKTDSPDAFLSKLEKNQDLKNALLEESPWVMQAKDESERKQRIGLLFDMNKMDNELQSAVVKLNRMQLSNGGWPWFSGGSDNKYITMYILTGFGKLQKFGALPADNVLITNMLRNAIRYADDRMFEDFSELKKDHPDYREKNYLNRSMIQYLYARAFFISDHKLSAQQNEGFMYIKEQAKKYWSYQDRYVQGMIALALYRLGEKSQPAMIMASVKEHALYDDEMGMYWRKDPGFYWYEAPVETQSLLIEAFDEIVHDEASVEDMKNWLLKNKQTSDWKTSRATADACYALLLRGTDLLASEGQVHITVGNDTLEISAMDDVKQEAGTGYFRKTWNGGDIQPELASVSITKDDAGIAWGAVYWQYFEDLDKITSHSSTLSITRKLYLEENSLEGPVLQPVNDGSRLKAGDRVVSRIEIRTDRDMEFVHLKDMRAAAFEPVNTTSGYRWQGGLGYYESIRDASVSFFFDYLPKGTWVFEYSLFVTQRGSFSNGISSIECMYAPEFSCHTEGGKVLVE